MTQHSNPTLSLGDRVIGAEAPPFVIAEAGVHHNNSIHLARAYIRAARVAGADAVKFQTYSADRIVTRWAPTYWDDPVYDKQHDVFAERSLLSADAYGELFAYADELGIMLLSTPFDEDATEMLARHGMAAFKIASADLTHFPLLETVAATNRPILLSTGAATLDEIDATVDYLQRLGASFGLLHCVLSYPTRVVDANLSRIRTLQVRYPDLIIGYSDHTQPQDSPLACPLAVGLGARVIEKHFTLNKLAEGDDHYHAVDTKGLAQLVRDCRDAYRMTLPGDDLLACEQPARTHARRSIVAARNLQAGQMVRLNDIDYKRPGTGLPPTAADQVLGHTLRVNKSADDLILPDDLVST